MDLRREPHCLLRFGSFELDVRSRELRDGSRRVRLQDQPFEILRVMLERPGDVVTRDELRRRLWPDGTFVDFEHSLNAAVKRLRAALGDEAERPRFVETLPRRGYRFIAPLERSDAMPARAAETRSAPLTRVAVLPFSNLSHDSEQDYFSDGLTEELIAQLGKLCRGRIGVIARWSSMAFKGTGAGAREIGEALRASYLLEGSVRRFGDRARITARLIESSSEVQLWSETYDRTVSDCVSVQADVAARIARSLAMELAPGGRDGTDGAPPTPAYQAYLMGRYYWNTPGDEGLDQAVACYERALGLAPSFGDARAALARAQVLRAEHYRTVPRQSLVAAREAASHALERNSTLYEAYLALAETHRMLDWDWHGAESAYTQAIALNPSFESAHRGYAAMLSVLSRHGEARREAERARELDPLCLVVGTTAAWVRYAEGDIDAAITQCRHTIDTAPEYVPARRLLGAAYLQAGRTSAALAELESAAETADSDPALLAWLSHAKATSGSRSDAVRLVERVRALATDRYVSPYHLAVAHVGLGARDEAFAALDQAYADRDPLLANVTVEPRFGPLRSDERYVALLGRLRIPV